MKKRLAFLTAIAVTATTLLTGCGGSVGAPTKESPVTLKIGVSTGESDPRNVAAELFAAEIEEKTEGAIKAQVYPSGELGGDSDLISKLSLNTGEVDIVITDASNFANYEPKMGISALPFLFEDFDMAWEFMDSDIEAEAESNLPSKNMRVLAHYCNGFRCVTNSKKSIETPSDMSGMLIRTPENPIIMATMSALGANPQPLSFSELYDALAKGNYDAQENPIPVIYNNNLYEVQTYLSVTNHIYSGMCFTIRENVWQSFTDEQKEIVETAAKNSADVNRNTNREQTQSLISALKEQGMVISTPNLDPFKEATESVITANASSYGDLIDKLNTWRDKH